MLLSNVCCVKLGEDVRAAVDMAGGHVHAAVPVAAHLQRVRLRLPIPVMPMPVPADAREAEAAADPQDEGVGEATWCRYGTGGMMV